MVKNRQKRVIFDWLIDWLIDSYLMSSSKYLMHIENENMFKNLWKLTTTGKVYYSCRDEEITPFVMVIEATICLRFFEIYLRGFWYAGCVACSKHPTHYGPWSGHLGINYELIPENCHQYPPLKMHVVSYVTYDLYSGVQIKWY